MRFDSESKNNAEPMLKTHVRWSQSSPMHLKYEHWFGNESSEAVLQAYGVSTPADSNSFFDALKPKTCPQCRVNYSDA